MIDNWVRFEDGVTHTMLLDDHDIVEKVIKDPVTGKARTRRSLTFEVVELDGLTGHWAWSILSAKLAAQFEPYLGEQKYRGRRVRVTQSGTGFLKEYTVIWL